MKNKTVFSTHTLLSDKLPHINDLYRRMIDEVQDYAIILLDIDGIILHWNKGAQKIKQYHESEIIGRHFSIFYLPEDRQKNLPQHLLNEAMEKGRMMHEGWRVRKDGSKFWGSVTLTALHDDQGNVFAVSKVTRDLTENKMAEDRLKRISEELKTANDALRSSEERYYKMIAEVEDYAIILLDKEGHIQNWNAGAQKIKGYDANEIIGKHFRIFYLPEDRESGLPDRLISEAERNGKATHEGWRRRKDGTAFWGSIVITALHGNDGSVIGFSKVTRDLTERKNAEDQMRHYVVELETRNAELEQFTYIASHDLQEPLRKIQTFTDVIETNLDNHALVKRYFKKINDSSQRMSDLIRSVLNYSRLARKGIKFTPTDLNYTLKTVKEDLELPISEKKAKIVCDQLPVLNVDPVQMSQLFFNLIANALKFTDKDPLITVSYEKVDSATLISENTSPLADKYHKISVVDNGIGFDQQFGDIIFNMFQRLHNKHEYSGTGIGLALCRKIAENHNGFITAESEPGKGASFYIYLPVEGS